MDRLQEKYIKEAVPVLTEKFGYKNVMQLPKVAKIVINMNSQGISSLNYRTMQTIGCEKLLISDDRAELDLFDNKIPTYKDVEDLKQLIKHYLVNKKEYDDIDMITDDLSKLISDFLFIHHNILNNFKLMIDILDKNVSFNVSEDILSFGNKRNSVIKDLLYKFLIKFYIRLYNLDENNFKFKSNEMKFKKIKSFCDKKFKSDRMIDILDITRNEEIIKEYKKRNMIE